MMVMVTAERAQRRVGTRGDLAGSMMVVVMVTVTVAVMESVMDWESVLCICEGICIECDDQ